MVCFLKEKSMRIIVTGNINAGKTYVTQKLNKILKDYKSIRIDDYRIKYSDGSFESDKKTLEIFSIDCAKEENAIIEMSGVGKSAYALKEKLNNSKYILVQIDTSLDTCLSRIESKDFNVVPYPVNENVEDSIRRIDKLIKEGIINKIFDNPMASFKIKDDDDLSSILKCLGCL